MTEPLVLRTDTDGVAVVELNRPRRKNAMTGPLMTALADTMEAVAADPSVEAVVLTGAGGAFCSGLDLDEFQADPSPDWMADFPGTLRRAHVSLSIPMLRVSRTRAATSSSSVVTAPPSTQVMFLMGSKLKQVN